MEHTIVCVDLDIRKILDSIMRVLKKVRKFKEGIKLREGQYFPTHTAKNLVLGEGGGVLYPCTLRGDSLLEGGT